MKNNKQLLLALTLAFSGFAAHAANLDIRLPDNLTSAPPNSAALAPSTPAAAPVAPAAAPAAAIVAPPAKPQAAAPVQAPAKPAVQAATPAPAAKPAVALTPAVTPAAKPAAPAAAAQSVAEPSKVVVGFGNDKAAPSAAPAAAAPATSPAAAVANVANPFTGKSLSLESRQRSIEEAKLDTELLNERLKQATMLADLTYVPIKKQAEVASLPNVQKVQTKDAGAPAAKEASAAPAKKITKSKKKGAAKEVPPATPVVAVPADPVLTVSSISINGRNASIVLEAQGNVMSARHGESTPFGTVQVIDSRTVTVGGRQLKVREAVISRMVVSDPPVIDPKSMAATAAPRTTPAAPATSTSNLPPLPQLPPPPKALSFSSKG